MNLVPEMTPSPISSLPEKSVAKINQLAKPRPISASTKWVDRRAKYVALNILTKLERGTVILRDGYDEFVYGEPLNITPRVAHIEVLDPSFYRHILLAGTVGSGEAYIQNTWRSDDLTGVIEVMVMNLSMLSDMNSSVFGAFSLITGVWQRLIQKNSKVGAKRNIAAHYDLSNEFFKQFLDATMMYSSAIYPSAHASLYEASQFKLQKVCEKLELTSSDHLLEIGSGWGGLAIYCAKKTGCRVTTITLSKEQFEHVNERIKEEKLSDKVDVHLCDYRDIQGKYDKLVSIEMIEAVGHQYFADYFLKCSSLLKSSGKMLIQSITIPHDRYEKGKFKMDFIRAYIFPGGCLPSQYVIMKNITECTNMELIGFEDITQHYARTLKHWHEAFKTNYNEIKKLGFDDFFMRMWEFYLCYSEGGFRQRVIGTSQWLFAKPE
jgi:cyclopropane-fatty-acyl-phospholipid synthase